MSDTDEEKDQSVNNKVLRSRVVPINETDRDLRSNIVKSNKRSENR